MQALVYCKTKEVAATLEAAVRVATPNDSRGYRQVAHCGHDIYGALHDLLDYCEDKLHIDLIVIEIVNGANVSRLINEAMHGVYHNIPIVILRNETHADNTTAFNITNNETITKRAAVCNFTSLEALAENFPAAYKEAVQLLSANTGESRPLT